MLFAMLIVIISFYYDSWIIEQVPNLKNNLFNSISINLNIFGEIIIFILLTLLFFWKEEKRKWIIPLWITLLSSAVVSFILKIIIQRPRPFQLGLTTINSLLNRANFSTWNFSFPSFDTMFIFSAVPLLSKEFPKLKKIWIILAVIIGLSRVYLGLHFLSDVIAGGIIGYFIGIKVIKSEKENKFGERYYRIFSRRYLKMK